ncbi:TfpX/TfpZ family type IV pilin accessory protein [Dokdonella koreensis]|uniref:Fimbrial assembly protein FimB n=1 Tax=Dokdonella koreensis DS-123 TaxID=1300342 RepID=A0A167H1U4_9GAMM|nr:TfpX/TfpZ family type IV pilin accessory protein [Dokdonella koreensis]ANB18536.1 Fimbrial assembly protein FimB [Dokdonella koreensis DS-123]
MSRWKAASIHLCISLAIGLIAALLIFGVWYPPPYAQAAGASHLVLLLLGVDLLLGPLLTLVVFKAGKKSLRFDLSVIALVQIAALVYGLSIVVRARPAFIVGADDRFTLVSAYEVDAADLADGRAPLFQSASWTGPRLVAVQRPTAEEEKKALTDDLFRGKDLEYLPRHYVDYEQEAPNLASRGRPLAELRNKPGGSAVLDAWLERSGRKEADAVYVPLRSSTSGLAMILEPRSGKLLDVLPIDPW